MPVTGVQTCALPIFPKDLNHAARLYKIASDNGDPAGEGLYGTMLLVGLGVEKNEATGAALIRKSAEAGDPHGQTTLGKLYYSGQGVVKDIHIAARWFQKAALNGDEEAVNAIKEPDVSAALK